MSRRAGESIKDCARRIAVDKLYAVRDRPAVPNDMHTAGREAADEIVAMVREELGYGDNHRIERAMPKDIGRLLS